MVCIGTVNADSFSIILNRLKEELKNAEVIPDEQAGFRDAHCATDQLLRITTKIKEVFNWNKDTTAVFLDVEKAFIKILHNGLQSLLCIGRERSTHLRAANQYNKKRAPWAAHWEARRRKNRKQRHI